MKKQTEYFTRFPNEYIQGNIRTKFGVSRKFYIVYILIDKYRSIEDYSWITIRKVLDFYGYKTHKNKPKAFGEVLDVLEYMVNNKMIEINQDLNSVNYDTGIEIKIVSNNFDYADYFTKFTSDQFNVIMMNESSLNRECLLMAFLYITSYIRCRPRNDDGTEKTSDPSAKPEAFFGSIEKMAKELAMSKDTIMSCIEYFTSSSENRNALLVKREVGSIQPNKDQPPKNVPNIYVLNKEGYKHEIEWAFQKMLELYSVEDFEKKKGGVRH